MRIHGFMRPLNKIGFQQPVICKFTDVKPQNRGMTFARAVCLEMCLWMCLFLLATFQGVRLVSKK